MQKLHGAALQFIKKPPIYTIIIFTAILRFWGIWHGYPFSYYPDEQHFVNRAMTFGSGDLNPHWFHKPAFLMYILFFEYGIFFLFGKVVGIFPNVDAFATYYFTNTWPFILMGRITVTIFGIATVYVTYKIAEKFWSKIEPIIGHVKSDNRMERNHLHGKDGDRINAMLAGCGFNMRKLIKAFLCLISRWLFFNKKSEFGHYMYRNPI